MIKENLQHIKAQIPSNVTLVAVSKTKPKEDILEAYQAGQRVFGENKAQEMQAKHEALPKDIEWHLIGHLQSNKVKYIAPFVKLIHSVDSLALLKEINHRAEQNKRTIDVLLQVKIAQEESKFGMDTQTCLELLNHPEIKSFKNISIIGLMGMSSLTDDMSQVRKEFKFLKTFFDKVSIDFPQLKVLSMGMSGDYKIAIEEGSNMVRVGSSIFGERNYTI